MEQLLNSGSLLSGGEGGDVGGQVEEVDLPLVEVARAHEQGLPIPGSGQWHMPCGGPHA